MALRKGATPATVGTVYRRQDVGVGTLDIPRNTTSHTVAQRDRRGALVDDTNHAARMISMRFGLSPLVAHLAGLGEVRL
jgi:hypothetical protein